MSGLSTAGVAGTARLVAADEWLEQMAILAGFAVVVTLVAARLFRWDST
jgi:arginine exporter protein ArgO